MIVRFLWPIHGYRLVLSSMSFVLGRKITVIEMKHPVDKLSALAHKQMLSLCLLRVVFELSRDGNLSDTVADYVDIFHNSPDSATT